MALLQSAVQLARQYYDELKKKQLPAVSSAVQKVGNVISNEAHQLPQQTANFTTNMFRPQVQGFQTLQNIAASPQVQNFGRQVVQNPIVKQVSRQPLLNPIIPFMPGSARNIGPTIGQYAQGQYIKPLQALLSKNNNIPDKIQAGVQLGFNTFTPGASTGYNVGSGAVTGILKTIRKGGNLNRNISESIAKPSDVGGTGLGLPVIPAAIVDALAANPKGIVKGATGVVKGLKGYSPRAFDIHPQDQEIMADFVNTIQTGKGKANLGQLGKDAQAIAEHYIGKKAVGLSNEKLARVFDALLSSSARSQGVDALQTPFPKMGFVSDGKSSLLDAKFQNTAQAMNPKLSGIGQTGSRLQDKMATGLTNDLTKSNTSGGSIPNFDAQAYIKELTQKQSKAGSSSPTGKLQGVKNFYAKAKAALVDSTSPIEDLLTSAEKKNKFQVRPEGDVRLQIDRVLRSKSLASQFAEDNGLTDVIKNAPDLQALDQYMIAKQASRVTELGKTTGRDSAKDAQLIAALGPQFEQHAQAVNQYSRKLLDYSVESGLIDKSLARQLTQKYPDYVPLQRVFNELEKNSFQGAGKAIASLSKQSVVKKIEGSNREIASPIESLLLKTQTAFEQGEKNKAARMLASYKDLPTMKNIIKELPSGQSATHSFSYLDNGVKKTFETTPEIAAAAKNLNQEQMNVILKILSVPTRILQLGATGLNLPFVATNIAKDQVTAFVNSNKAARSSLLNPVNFGRALFSAVKHDDLYNEVVRNAGMQTSFDIARDQPNLSVTKLRSGKAIGSKIAFTATHPGELLRGIENVIGRAEEATRIQQYRGTYKALIGEGRTPQDARLLAAQAARNNTANFARKGDIGKVINYVIPFFNAGIQGSRSFVRAMQTRPLETGAKVAIGVFAPIAATTMWNLNDPERKKVYEDINDYEKQNNIIIIPDGATKDAKGKWNVIKIPLPPGLSNLGTVVRRSLEQANGMDPVSFSEAATNFIAAGTAQDLSSLSKLLSTFTPQAVKPFVESATNTNLFTGNKIVPDSMKDLPPNQQVRDYTSGTARLIGGALNQSPLKVENFVRTAAGGVGSQLINASDTVLNKAGVVPDSQVGGENPIDNINRRFLQASGGAVEDKNFNDLQKYKTAEAQTSANRKAAITKVSDILLDPGVDRERKLQIVKALQSDKTVFNQVKDELRDRTTNVQSVDKAIRSLSTKQRALYIKERLGTLQTVEEKRALIIDYQKKGILTKSVVDELKKSK